MGTTVHGDFEWDDEKAQANVRKHGVPFEEAATAFADEMAMVLDDGGDEGDLWLVGMSGEARIVVVVHLERGKRVRIVSARKATRNERKAYSDPE